MLAQALKCLGVVGIIDEGSSEQILESRIVVGRKGDESSEGGHSLAQIGAGDLAGGVGVAMSTMSSASWKATPICSPNCVMISTMSSGAPAIMAPKRPEVAMSEPVLSASTRR